MRRASWLTTGSDMPTRSSATGPSSWPRSSISSSERSRTAVKRGDRPRSPLAIYVPTVFSPKIEVIPMLYRIVLSLVVCSLACAQSERPDRILAHAVELHQSGDLEAAVREYREFLKVYPDVPQVRSNLGAALAKLGR